MVPSGLLEPIGNVLNVELGQGVKFEAAASQRFGTISSSCGLCGKTSIEFIRQQFPSVAAAPDFRIDEATLLELPEGLRSSQSNFARTGGIHAAGIFGQDGKLIIGREDIGRHNAVDKAIGRALFHELLPL